jgi:hypothetical protein
LRLVGDLIETLLVLDAGAWSEEVIGIMKGCSEPWVPCLMFHEFLEAFLKALELFLIKCKFSSFEFGQVAWIVL